MTPRYPRRVQLLLFLSLCTVSAFAGRTSKNIAIPHIQALRAVNLNTQSNIEFWQTNFCELFLDLSITNGRSGTWWPRDSAFPYIFGGGAWFGALKNGMHHVLVGYNPSSGRSWFQPGTVAAAQSFFDSVRLSPAGVGRYPAESDNSFGSQYPVFFSTQYDPVTGLPLNPGAGLPPWPIWDTDPDTTVIL